SAEAHSWLADHVISGERLVPAAALVEMAIRAGDEVGCGSLAEMVLQTPLVLPETAELLIQIVVRGAGSSGGRRFELYPSAGDAGLTESWSLHANGLLSSDNRPAGFDLRQWPPAGATPVEVSGFYPSMADDGVQYGPAFRGVRAVWRRGEEVL